MKAFPADDPRAFADALARLCDAAEAMDGVDSSRWVLARERGTPSRWEAHPTVLDGDEGIEVASERAKKDAVWKEEKEKTRRTTEEGVGRDASGGKRDWEWNVHVVVSSEEETHDAGL